MNIRIYCAAFFLNFCFLNPGYSQEAVSAETSPASMNWYQINTDHFKLLYPLGFEREAQRVANTLEHIREPEAASLGVKPKKISIVLHSQSAVSNGFVTLAPRRSEFFAMPPQNYNFIGNNEWLTLLSSHEYRHIVQFQKSLTGFNKAIHLLFGQLAQAGMAFVAVPQWFWEGDAVAVETAFTNSGRGRIPEFDLLLRTNFLENRNFNYHKQYLRSYKHNVPDHYVLGYHMVSHLRNKTGNPNVWADITQRAWKVPFIPFAFSNAIKKETGMHVNDLYKDMAKEIKQDWEAQLEDLSFTKFSTINKRTSSAYTDYSYPQPISNGGAVVLKSGIGDFSQLVTVTKEGKEHKAFVPGPVNDAGMLSAAGNKVVWNEYRLDPRWQTRSYSIIKGFDITAKKTKVIARHARYGAAALSPDGKKVATVVTDDNYNNNLVVIDYESGQVVRKVENPDNHFISMPRWSNDGKQIVFLQLIGNQKKVAVVNEQFGDLTTLFEAGDENVGHPILHNNFLIYNSPASGIDNIYAMDISAQRHYQVTSSKYGAYNPSVSADGSTIWYNEQTRNGLDIVTIPFDPSTWKAKEMIQEVPSLFAEMLSEQEGQPALMESVPNTAYPTKRYHRGSGMINPHSWGVYTTSSFNTLDLGITSKDVLSTTVIDMGYRFDVTEQTGLWRANVSYQGMYPVLDFQMTYGQRSGNEDYVQGGTLKTINFDWEETQIESGLRIPLNLTHSKYSTRLSIGNSIGITKVNNFKNDLDGGGRFIDDSGDRFLFRTYADNGQLIFNHFSFDVFNLMKRSRRDIVSKWGQTLELDYYSTPYPAGDFTGAQFSAFASTYFPGLMKHHSLWFYGSYQHALINNRLVGSRPDNYLFRNLAPSPRGHSISRFQDYYMVAANYTFPIIYPDIALGPVLNIQRVRGNAFADYGFGQSTLFGFDRTYSSVGGELKVDFNFMRLLQQFNLGVRYAYPIETQSPTIELIIGNIGF